MTSNFYSGKAYKYCSVETFKIIVKNQTLRFTRGDQFNDPYEANPFLVPVGWNELVKPNKSNFKVVQAIAKEAFHRISSEIYITCFSKSYLNKKSRLMWSHYGDAHKGVCFEIEFPKLDRDNYKQGSPVPIEVSYCKSLRAERDKRTVQSEDLPLFLATYKSEEWQYEQEVRAVVYSGAFDSSLYTSVNDGRNIDVCLNINEIKRVIFGIRTNHDDIESIVKIFCEKGLLPDFYQLDVNPITLETELYNTGIKEIILDKNKKA